MSSSLTASSSAKYDEDDVLPAMNDPIISSELANLSASRTRVGTSGTLSMARDQPLLVVDEAEPLLGGDRRKRRKKPFYRPRPLWIVPFAVLASIARGMTIAPRVEVFTQLSCSQVFGHPSEYNHTHISPMSSHIGTVAPISASLSSGTLEDPEVDDPLRVPSKRCLSDTRVQAGAARLQTIMTTTMGLLSALTTGWWGHFGERHGRTRVLTAATLGLLLTDLAFILVSLPQSPFAAHGHKLLVVVPVVEGLLGGWSTLQGATSAYISDCTSDGSRAHIFSRFMGVYYFGFALGPMLGAWLISHPPPLPRILLPEPITSAHTVTPVFYVAVLCSSINFFLTVFVFPESLSKEKRIARRLMEAETSAAPVRSGKSLKGGIHAVVRSLFLPLMVFAPKKRASGPDRSMLFLGLALFGYLLSAGIFQIKYLYAEHAFGWEAQQLSYYITAVGGARAVNLLFIMPFIIATFKPKPTTSPAKQGTGNSKKTKPTRKQLAAEIQFDLLITRFAYGLDLLSHTLVSFSSTAKTLSAQSAFVGFTMLSSFACGIVPSMQSLALCIIQADAAEAEDESAATGAAAKPRVMHAAGSLFGALAVLQATGQMILGPMIFGLVYSTTVARFPKGIFVLAASIVLVSIILLAFVRPHLVEDEQKKAGKGPGGRHLADREIERGRPRTSKVLSDSGRHTGSDASSSNTLENAPEGGPASGM